MPPTPSSSRKVPHKQKLSAKKPPQHQQRQQQHANSKKKKARSEPPAVLAEGPLHDRHYIQQLRPAGISPSQEENPKNTLDNITSGIFGSPVQPATSEVTVEHNGSFHRVWRVTYSFVIPMNNQEIHAIGDGPNAKQARILAALHCIYQLGKLGLLNVPAKKLATKIITLSDGTVVDYDKSKSFMDFYCRRYSFGKPEVHVTEVNGFWEATLSVNGRRIGLGSARNKKGAEDSCYTDATRYLESCDPELWKAYLKAVETGADLGLATTVPFNISPRLTDDIRDLCVDIRSSSLYRSHRAPDTQPSMASQSSRRRFHRVLTPDQLSRKSLALADALLAYNNNSALENLRKTRASLPVYTRIQEVLDHIKANDVTILMAATGSGKTTQIPQLILDDFIKKGNGASCNVLCTQPRRLAAISVADRVAKERGEQIGRTIGYQVRFEARLPEPNGSVTFCTTGIFLKKLQSQLEGLDNGLDNVTHVVVDEVHERDVDTDLLLVVLKRLMALRKEQGRPLKVILMSATIDPTLFQHYFPDSDGQPAKVISVPGRSYPVEQHFLDDFVNEIRNGPLSWALRNEAANRYMNEEFPPAAPNVPLINATNDDGDPPAQGRNWDHETETPHSLIAATVSHVMQKTNEGHCLVFLPGWEDISGVQRALLNPEGPLGINFNSPMYSLHLLHSTIPLAEQQVIFDPAPAGTRRVILSTNIAETSVTIPDVVYVVDSGRVKETRYNPQKHISALVSAWVGRSNLFQRAGRAGRHRPGEYYGLLSRAHVDALAPNQTVEMKRVDLSNVVMHIKALNFNDLAAEEVLSQAIEPPEPKNVEMAMRNLQLVGALDKEQNLTSLGRLLLKLPIDVQLGRLILFGSFFRCLDRALTLAALLSNRDPFLSPKHMKNEARAAKNSFATEHYRSDAIAALLAYEGWWAAHTRGGPHASHTYCIDNFVSKPTFMMVAKVKDHILAALHDAGVLQVSGGGTSSDRSDIRRLGVPAHLNVNSDNLPLLASLFTLAVQPKIAVRNSASAYRSARDKGIIMHQSSVNAKKRDNRKDNEDEKQLVAYAESRVNMSTNSKPTTVLAMTTRIDPLIYLLFGAYTVESAPRGLDCDGWLPVVGPVKSLDDVWRLKKLTESCMLRVFEGIIHGGQSENRSRLRAHSDSRDEEEWEEEDTGKNYSLSQPEVQELDFLTRDLVSILARYAEERGFNSSLQADRSGNRSQPHRPRIYRSTTGYNTPVDPQSFASRPNTPSSQLFRPKYL